MKLFVVALILPFVLGQDCPALPEPVPCEGSDLMCGGEPDAAGCPTATWCLPNDPEMPCPAFCPCGANSFACPGPADPASECPMQDMCLPMPTEDDACPATCPSPPCEGSDLTCGGEPDAAGCPTETWCLPNDPEMPCPAFCPCGANSFACPGPADPASECPMQDMCLPMPTEDDACPATCPSPPCEGSDLTCGGEPDAAGCPTETWCLANDPEMACPAFCPCGANSIACLGPADPASECPTQDMCLPMPTEDDACPVSCPENCGENQMPCGGDPDENGCAMPMWCLDSDPTAICPSTCPPPPCPPDMIPCPMGQDDNGCEIPMVCHAMEDPCPAPPAE